MSRRYGYMFRHLKQSFMPRKDFNEMVDTVESMMKKVILSMVDKRVNEFIEKLVPSYVVEGLLLDKQKDHTNIVALVDSFLRDYILTNTLHVHPTKAASSSIHDLQYQLYLNMKDDEQVLKSIWWSLKIKFEKPTPSVAPYRIATVRTRDHEYHHDDDARPKGESNDDEVLSEEISPELLKEISREVDEAQLQKAVIDMLRESRKEYLSLQIPKKPVPVYQSCERDPKALPMSLLNQDLFYLKHGNSGPQKYVLLLHKYPAVPFPKNDIEELTLRWEKKRDNPDEVYSESKIIEVVRTLHDLGHEHKYIIEIVVRRADGNFDAFSESDYKYLYKNDIEDLYLMCINGKERVHDYLLGLESYQKRVNLTAPAITFPSNERKKVLTITSKLVAGLIYENNKKENSVMIIKDILKLCDATLIRVLKLVEKKNMDVKHEYADPKFSDKMQILKVL
ncbi:hypothetical protein Tco_0319949 [Tanacetum coccineum]